ncbi:hypothetical protein AVEN_72953-1, partial [Araneus ventricosus]
TRGLFWDGPRNFEPQSDDEDDARAGTHLSKLPRHSRFLGVGSSRRPRAAIGPLAPTIDDCSNSRVSPQFWKPVATL